MEIVKPKTRKIARTNLKKSVVFGGTLGAISAAVGLSIVIPTYVAIQAELATSIERFSDISDFLVQLSRMLGIKPGEDFQSDLENGYVVEVTSTKDDGSMTLVFRKTGAPATLIINIDANGNLTSAGEIYGPAASDILNSINSAADIFEKDAEAMDEILGSVNKEIDFNSLKIEYILRKNFVEGMIDDLDVAGELPQDKYSYGNWLDFGMASLLVARNIKDDAGGYLENTPQSIISYLKDPNNASDITDPTLIESMEDLFAFIDDDSFDTLEKIAKAIIDLELEEQGAFETEGISGIEESLGSEFDNVESELDSEKDTIGKDFEDKASDIVQDINEAKDDLVIANAPGDITLLYKLIEKPSLWIPAYLKTNTLRDPLREAIIKENKMSASNFDFLIEKLKQFDLTDSSNKIDKLSVINIADTYNNYSSALASLIGLKFEKQYTNNTKDSSILLGIASDLSMNDLRSTYIIDEISDANQWSTVNLYLDQYYEDVSESVWKNSVLKLKEIAGGENIWNHPKLDSDDQPTNISNAYRYASRIRDDDYKKNLALSVVDKIANEFYFKGKSFKFSSDQFEWTFENLIDLEPEDLSTNDAQSIYRDGTRKFTEIYLKFVDNFVGSTDTTTKLDFDKFNLDFDMLISKVDGREMDAYISAAYGRLLAETNGWNFVVNNILKNKVSDYVLSSWDEFIKAEHWTDPTLNWDLIFSDDDIWELSVGVFESTPEGPNPQLQKVEQIKEFLFFSGQGGIEEETIEKINKIKLIETILLDRGVKEADVNEVTALMRVIIEEDILRTDTLKKWLKNNPSMSESDYAGPQPLSVQDVSELVDYTETIFKVTTFDSLALDKLKTVFSSLDSNGDLTIFNRIGDVEELNDWIEELDKTHSVITDEIIEDYVWHKDPVISATVNYKNGATPTRPMIISVSHSNSSGKNYAISHDQSNGILELDRNGNETVASYYSPQGAPRSFNTTSFIYESAKHNLLITSMMVPENGIMVVDLNKPMDGSFKILDDVWFDNQTVRNMHVDSLGHLVAIVENTGEIWRTNASLEDWDGSNTNFMVIFERVATPSPAFNMAYASELISVNGIDYVVISDASSSASGTHHGRIESYSLDPGQKTTLVSSGSLKAAMASMTTDPALGYIYGISTVGDIWKIDPTNVATAEKFIELSRLEATEDIGGEPIWGTTVVSSNPFIPKTDGFRNIYYNPLEKTFVIYGLGIEPRDIYIPDKSHDLIDIFEYLIK